MRPGEAEEATRLETQRWRDRGASIAFMDADLMEISSTEVRARIAQGQPTDDLLPAAVADYIVAHGLYRA